MFNYSLFIEVSISIAICIFFSACPTRCLSSTDISFAVIASVILSWFVQNYLLVIYVTLLGILHLNNMICNPLYKFRNLLGKVGTGVHSIMIFDVPIVDYFFTAIGAQILSYYLETNLLTTFGVFYVSGQILHYLFGVNTRFFNLIGIRFEEEKKKKDD